nr:unnamed protein product [Spirometra erinaceieuropaei]
MFRTLYIFVAIYILRGCPKIMPLVDDNRNHTSSWVLNFTSIPATFTPSNVRVEPLGGYYVSSDAKLTHSSPSAEAIYTGITPSDINAHPQPRAFVSTSDVQTITLDVVLRRWPVFLIAGLIFCAAVALATFLMFYTAGKYEASRKQK